MAIIDRQGTVLAGVVANSWITSDKESAAFSPIRTSGPARRMRSPASCSDVAADTMARTMRVVALPCQNDIVRSRQSLDAVCQCLRAVATSGETRRVCPTMDDMTAIVFFMRCDSSRFRTI